MKNLTKAVLVVLAAVVLVSTVAVLTPRAVHALTAQLVQNVDSPPRNPWTGTCSISYTNYGSSVCYIATPPGYEVTIQTVTFSGTSSLRYEQVTLTLTTTTAGQSVNPAWNNQIDHVIAQFLGPGITQYASSLQTTLYADPSSQIEFYLTSDGFNPPIDGFPGGTLGGTVVLMGYSVNVGAPPAG
jgi:hypothetical protein